MGVLGKIANFLCDNGRSWADFFRKVNTPGYSGCESTDMIKYGTETTPTISNIYIQRFEKHEKIYEADY